jgi:hypothetical protein
MAGDFDDSDIKTPAPMLFDPARESDPRAREWAQREVEYVTKIATLQAEVGQLRIKCARLALELRRRVSAAPKKPKEVK